MPSQWTAGGSAISSHIRLPFIFQKLRTLENQSENVSGDPGVFLATSLTKPEFPGVFLATSLRNQSFHYSRRHSHEQR